MNAPVSSLPPVDRERSWLGAYANGALWALGNGLVGTTLITYLAKELGAQGTAISLILAFPNLFGVFRLLAPPLLARLPGRKRFSVTFFVASAMLLLCIPLAYFVGRLTLTGLVALWGLWHLAMYAALIPYFSWLGELASGGERPRRLAIRESAMVAATIVGTLAAAAILAWWNRTHPTDEYGYGLAWTASIGGVFLLLSVMPLAIMRETTANPSPLEGAESTFSLREERSGRRPDEGTFSEPNEQPKIGLRLDPSPRRLASPASPARGEGELKTDPLSRELLDALCDPRYRSFLAFNAWFSLANGFTAAAVAFVPFVLGISATTMLLLQTGMRVGQTSLGPATATAIACFGHRRVFIICQLLVAMGLAFYLPATKSQPWWIVGAWVCWIAYIGHNVGLPNLMLRLAPRENSPAYIAVSMALSGVVFALASLAGGLLLDYLRRPEMQSLLPGGANAPFSLVFSIGVALRLLTIVWIRRLPVEPLMPHSRLPSRP